MPIITITLAEKQTTTEQKEQLIKQITADSVDITKLPSQAFTILINELPEVNIGCGGLTLPEAKKAMNM